MGTLRAEMVELLRESMNEYFKDGAWKSDDIPISDAVGRYLAEDITGEEDLPGYGMTAAQARFKTGHRLTPKDIGILAAMGRMIVPVWCRPYVTILTIGNEWVSLLDRPAEGQMRDSNSFALHCALRETGAQIVGMNLVRGRKEAIDEAVRSAVDHSDFVVLTMSTQPGAEAGMSDIIRSMGQPGVIGHAPLFSDGGGVILGAIKDEFCHCAGRIPAFVACLPGRPLDAVRAYDEIVDYFLRKYYFRNI